MSEISSSVIADAKAGDLAAVGIITKATDRMIGALAYEAARKGGRGSMHTADLKEDLESVGRVALWEAIGRWNEEHASSAKPETFLHERIKGAIADELQRILNPGADLDALRTFVQCLRKAHGDLHLAERMTQLVPEAGRRLSADRAYAARLAYGGGPSLDAPAGGVEGGASLAETYVPPELETADDRNDKTRALRKELVHMALATLSPLRREVLLARARGGKGVGLEMSHADIIEVVCAELGGQLALSPTVINDSWRKGCQDFRSAFPLFLAYPERSAA